MPRPKSNQSSMAVVLSLKGVVTNQTARKQKTQKKANLTPTAYYPFTVFKTRSFSDNCPLLTDHGTSALISAVAGPTLKKNAFRTEIDK